MTIDEIVSRLGKAKKVGDGYKALCPGHDDKSPSLSISLGSDGKILVKCFAGCSTISIVNAIGLEMKDLFADSDPPIRGLGSNGSKAPAKATRIVIDKVYQYTDADGVVIYENVRYHPKDFRQRRPDGNGGYIYNLQGVRRVPYRLPELIERLKQPDPEIWLTEGEKDADTLRLLGLTASSFKNWRQSLNRRIKGAHTVLFRDHDASGVKQANDAARIIAAVARSIKVLDLFDGEPLPEKHGRDVSDWIDVRRSEGLDDETIAERLTVLVDDADTWQDAPDTTKSANGSVQEAQSFIDSSVQDVDGAELLDEIERFIGRFVSYPSEDARVAHTLWIAHTWLMDHWDSTPRLAALSPEPGSGKSRLLEVTEPLVPRAVHAVNTTPAYLFRKVSDPDGPPTILYDEIDTVFGPKAKDNEDVRGMLNAGHRKGAMAGRCVTRGKIIETEELPAFCAVALAGLNDLPDTLMTRSVVIRMRRRAPNERIEPWRQRTNGEEAKPIAERLKTWAGNIKSVDFAEPPPGIEDRNADVWEALLTVAALAGGEWPDRARVAAVALVASASDRTQSLGVQLLADLRTVFETRRYLATATIIEKLLALPESTWVDLRGKQLDSKSLSRLLRRYEIGPKQLRDGSRNIRGYERSDLEDPWSRYLPADQISNQSSEKNATNATGATTP